MNKFENLSTDLFHKYYSLLLELIQHDDINAIFLYNTILSYSLTNMQKQNLKDLQLIINSTTMEFKHFADNYINKDNLLHTICTLVRFNKLDIAQKAIDHAIEIEIYDKNSIKILRLYKILNDIREIQSEISLKLKNHDIEHIKIHNCIFYNFFNIEEISNKENWNTTAVFYYRPPSQPIKSIPFQSRSSHYDDNNILDKHGFSRPIYNDTIDKVYLLKNARIAGYDWKTWAIFDEHNNCCLDSSGKFIKLLQDNISYRHTRTDESIYILPFPHIYTNYYHFMSETIYGLRYIKFFKDNINILYYKDSFNLLKYFSEKMDIDFTRFIKIDTVLDVKFKFSFIPMPPPFYWDKKVFYFFQQFKPQKDTNKKIYISRSLCKDSRKLINELDLEKELKNNSIDIIHNENFSIEEQIEIFSSASTVIGPHGAGLTNILFCKSGFKFIELFSDRYIVPDFYLRSQHINAEYTPHICKNNKIDIDAVIKSIYK